MTRRFRLRNGPLGVLGRLPYGASDATAYVEVADDALIARFGWFRIRVPRSEIADVGGARWPWWLGSGWRVTFAGALIVGPPGDVVRVGLRRPRRWLLGVLPTQVRVLYLAVEDADGLRAAIASTA